ncbi:hypothetical protein FRC18_011570 [Serendipita sp. 400]|nr:hypothetical protein FRC18_011570 [Serendipita sp. 400]
MVSADNLPFDVLPLIFANVPGGKDLLSVALVSKSFNGAATPLIYGSITINVSVTKKLTKRAQSPFQTLLDRKDLDKFPRKLTITAVPLDRGRVSERFHIVLAMALPKLVNLSSFVFDAHLTVSFLPALLSNLATPSQLKELSLLADNLNPQQAKLLLHIGHRTKLDRGGSLQKLSLRSPSTCVLGVLPEWIERNRASMTSLSIKDSPSITSGFIQLLLGYTRYLTHLSLTQCPNLNHWLLMKTLETLPGLIKLQLAIFTYSPSPGATYQLTCLKHLSLHFMGSLPADSTPKLKATLSGFLAFFATCTLESFMLESMDQIVLPVETVKDWSSCLFGSLRCFNIVGVTILPDSLELLCRRTKLLEQICLDFEPEMKARSSLLLRALSKSESLQTITDSFDFRYHHHQGAPGQPTRFTRPEVETIFAQISTLKRIINAGRCWVRSSECSLKAQVCRHRRESSLT